MEPRVTSSGDIFLLTQLTDPQISGQLDRPPRPHPSSDNISKRFTLEDMFSSDFPSIRRPSITWISWDGSLFHSLPPTLQTPDGFYLVQNETNSDFLVGHVESWGGRIWNGTKEEDWSLARDGPLEVVLKGEELPRDKEGKVARVLSAVPAPGQKGRSRYLLLETQREKVWRHSHRSSYWVCRLGRDDMHLDTVDLEKTPTCAPLLNPSSSTTGSANDFSMDVQLAQFSPSGKDIIYVRENNLHLVTTASLFSHPNLLQITKDGNKHRILNGIADWVYEEEVFEATSALWPHPDLDRLFAFLRTDDSEVHEVRIPLYDAENVAEDEKDGSYPGQRKLRYPKAGSANPSVSVWIWDGREEDKGILSRVVGIEQTWSSVDGAAQDFLVLEAMWYPFPAASVSDGLWEAQLLIRTANRQQTVIKEMLATWNRSKGLWIADTVRTFTEPDGAWIEVGPPFAIDASKHVNVMNRASNGRNHIALVSGRRAQGVDRWLTWGSGWDVTGIIGIVNRTVVIFEATLDPTTFEKGAHGVVSGVERHIWSVDLQASNGPLPGLKLVSPISQDPSMVARKLGNSILQSISGGRQTRLGSRSVGAPSPARFAARALSPLGNYLVLSYGGSGVPWTELLRLSRLGASTRVVMERNDPIRRLSTDNGGDYEFPTSRVFEVPLKDENGAPLILNALEIRPPGFDDSGKTKYRALFRVYGGPSSQVVVPAFSLGFHEAIASLRGDPFVVFQVDGRGTFGRGRNFTSTIYRRLGQLEPQDQHAAARYLVEALPYLDGSKMAIWGWSFGGYLTSRVVDWDLKELRTFKAAIAVAPVTDWRFYDSVYTERYLDLPSKNPEGYKKGAVKGQGLGWTRGRTLVIHGTADGGFHRRLDLSVFSRSNDERIPTDNVHFQNTAALIAGLTRNLVPPSAWRAQFFSDSDHSVSSQGGKATQELYRMMLEWLDRHLGPPVVK